MSTDTGDLITWLRERLDEEEQTAHRAHDSEPMRVMQLMLARQGGKQAIDRFLQAHSPARVLAEVAAKRRILDACERWADPHPGVPCTNVDYPEDSCDLHVALQEHNVNPWAVRLLAQPYAGLPGWRDEWKVTE